MDEEKKIMSICGDNHVDVHATVEEMDLFTQDFAFPVIKLDPLLIKLLKLQDIKTFIEKLCKEQDLKVIWILSELNSTITCYCKDKKAVQDFRDVLYHNLEKKTYSMWFFSGKSTFSKCIKNILVNVWLQLLKKITFIYLPQGILGKNWHALK